ncbi:unnamed protein product [Prunus armeniaca]
MERALENVWKSKQLDWSDRSLVPSDWSDQSLVPGYLSLLLRVSSDQLLFVSTSRRPVAKNQQPVDFAQILISPFQLQND